MVADYLAYIITWRGFTIEARYDPNYCTMGIMAHLEVESINPPGAALPMTQTGYRSYFHPIGVIERDYGGDVVAAVTDWLDQAAESNDGNVSYTDDKRQGDLFAVL